MDLGVMGKVALVCGSTGGLGEAIARALAAEGVRVAVVGRNKDRATGLAADLPGAVPFVGDLSAPESAVELANAVVSAMGSVDILVLNGPGPAPATAAGLTDSALEAAIASLLLNHVALVSRLLPDMRKRSWGRILAVGSSGIASPLPDLASSNVGRSALAAYLKTLAAETAAEGVTVNLLLPGRISTDRVAALDTAKAGRTGLTVDEVEAASRANIPAGRYGEPHEFGAAAAFLCSQPASYITGVALRCDGGLVRSL